MVVRRQGRSRTRHYDDSHTEHLWYGWPIIGEGFGNPSDPDLEAAADAWSALKDRILLEFIADSPGCRPWGWWLFEAPPELRVATAREAREICSDPGWQTDRLTEAGELTEAEKVHLRQHGRTPSHIERHALRSDPAVAMCPARLLWEAA